MASIPIFTSSQTPQGFIRPGVGLREVDASGLVRGLSDMQAGIERQRAIADHEIKVQEQQREIADKAAAREQFLSMKDTLADEFETHSAGVIDGTIDKTSARTKWAEKTKALIDLGVEKVPPSQRAQIQSLLNFDAGRYERLVGRAVAKKDQSDTLGSINSQLEFAARMSETDYEGARLMAMDALQQFGPAAGLTSAQIQEKANKWKEEAAYTRGLGLITRAKRDNVALGKAEEQIGALPDLDPRRKVELLDRATGYRVSNDQRKEIEAQKAERLAERRLRVAEHEFNAFQAVADKGAQLDPNYIDKVVQQTRGTPYEAAVRGISEQIKAIGGFAARPIAQQRATIAALDQHIATNGLTPELDKRRTQLATATRQAEVDIDRDPFGAYAERGGGIAPQVDTGLDGLQQTIGPRVEHAAIVSRWAGKVVSPLTAMEADKVIDQLDALPVAQRSQRIAALATSMTPGQAQALAAQMDKKNRALALEFAAGASKTTAGRYTSELIARGRQALKDKAVKEDTAVSLGMRASIVREIGDSLDGRAKDDVIDAARFIMLGKEAEGNAINVRDAVSLALGGPLVEHNGKRIPVVAGIEDLPARLRAYPHSAINSQAPDGYVYLPGGRPMGVPEFLAALPDAQLEPAGFGRYYVRSGGSIAYNADRKPIVIDVRP